MLHNLIIPLTIVLIFSTAWALYKAFLETKDHIKSDDFRNNRIRYIIIFFICLILSIGVVFLPDLIKSNGQGIISVSKPFNQKEEIDRHISSANIQPQPNTNKLDSVSTESPEIQRTVIDSNNVHSNEQEIGLPTLDAKGPILEKGYGRVILRGIDIPEHRVELYIKDYNLYELIKNYDPANDDSKDDYFDLPSNRNYFAEVRCRGNFDFSSIVTDTFTINLKSGERLIKYYTHPSPFGKSKGRLKIVPIKFGIKRQVYIMNNKDTIGNYIIKGKEIITDLDDGSYTVISIPLNNSPIEKKVVSEYVPIREGHITKLPIE